MLLEFLPERDPKSIEITNNKFPSPIERIVEANPHFDPIFQLREEAVNVVRADIEIDFASLLGARVRPPST